MACTENTSNMRRRHSRNHHSQEVIMDFLTSLDKNKPSNPWQTQFNQINDEWCKMMQENSEEESLKENTSNKHVTWSEKLLDIKTISPRQAKTGRLSVSEKDGKNIQPFSRSSHQESFNLFNWKVL